MGEQTTKQISSFEAGLAGGLVFLVSFLGVREEGLFQQGNIRAGLSHDVYTSFQMSL